MGDEELKAPRHASAAAIRDGNLPHMMALFPTLIKYIIKLKFFYFSGSLKNNK